MRDTADVCLCFPLREAPRRIFVGPFENVVNVIAACADAGKLFDGERVVFIFICLNEPFPWCHSWEFPPGHTAECFFEFGGVKHTITILISLAEWVRAVLWWEVDELLKTAKDSGKTAAQIEEAQTLRDKGKKAHDEGSHEMSEIFLKKALTILKG